MRCRVLTLVVFVGIGGGNAACVVVGMQHVLRLTVLGLTLSWLTVGCGSDDPPPASATCDVDAQSGCAAGLACEKVEGGTTACFAPVFVEGRVLVASDGKTGIASARVAGRDESGGLASRDVAISGADGGFRLAIPAQRKADGTPVLGKVALRADAAGYATFPSGLRVALPIDVTAPTKASDGSYVIKNASTDVALDAITATGLGTVSGVVKAPLSAGTLVVTGGASGIAGRDGTFTVFNVPSGSQEVRGYQKGLQLKPATAAVTAGAETKGVELLASSDALAVVSGDVSFVNAGSSTTTVVLVVKSTFNVALARGEVPKGLRTTVSGGKYSLTDVPVGSYVVLAAFENDDLVRDPDTTIGGTVIQSIDVASAAVSVPGFKITGALAVVRPGAVGPEPVTGTPTFEWADDSSEDGYEVVVYDTFGKEIWRKTDVPGVSGAKTVTTTYAGPALTPGSYYQFRALSFRDKGKGGGRTFISMTEDLKGVFVAR